MKEIKAWAFAVGNAPGLLARRKVQREAAKAFKYIASLEGFLGFHPAPPRGTLCIFRSENDAKGAKNLTSAAGIQTGANVCEIFIPLADARGMIKVAEEVGE